MARKFFKNAALSSEIIKMERLIKRFLTILCELSCDYAIDEDAFDNYTMDTASLYVQLYR